ncbi:MAG: hypothetical protein IPK44_01745 [Candidatus Accumulibacter sp.]|uniref:hypothetical protein n=1 Tax=Accumulibacter sp. TaxID=2053492 RepID=UPI0025907FC2|nr:hypothetical protein [Accumulibacter sp.]MBK8113323.1 hypothetical protein [Accumulibacter sp.]
MGSGLPKVTTYKPKPRTNPLANSDRVQATEQQQQEKAWKFMTYLPNVQGGTQPKRTPMTVNGQAVQPQQPAPERAAKVPRERWVSSYAAQVQGPRNDGTVAGQAPYIGPYAGNAQRVPKYLDQNSKPYTPASQAEYQTWLNGTAFGVNNTGRIPRFSGVTGTDLELANLRRQQQGLMPLTESVFASQQQDNTAAVGAWQAAMDYPDLAARRATATTYKPPLDLSGLGHSAKDMANRLKFSGLLNGQRFPQYGPPAPQVNIQTDQGYPASNSGGGGGGYGGGGYGGYGGGGGGGGYNQQAAPWWYGLVNWRL